MKEPVKRDIPMNIDMIVMEIGIRTTTMFIIETFLNVVLIQMDYTLYQALPMIIT